MDASADLLVERRGQAGFITLNRLRALNALTHEMILGIDAALDAFQRDGDVRRIVIKGAGERAFCAGGDIKALYEWGRSGRRDLMLALWRDEYILNARIARFPKPVTAIVDGLAMGGGVGLFIHAGVRVTSEFGSFAMPEVGIGLFPDVGATHPLSRLPGGVGAYLAVTGLGADAADMRGLGLAGHGVARDGLGAFEAALEGDGAGEAIEAARADFGPSRLMALAGEIGPAFAAGSRAGLLASLAQIPRPWAAEALKALNEKSPTSQAIALRQIASARSMTLEDVLRQDFRIVWRIAHGGEFLEGVRAAVIDRDKAPRWAPFDAAAADAHFAPLGADELMLQGRPQ